MSAIRRHRYAVCTRLFRNAHEPGSVRPDAIQLSFYRRLLERGEIDPTILFINAHECLTHPKRDASRTRQPPLSFSYLVLECAIHSVPVQMHVAISLRWPKKVPAVLEEVEVVSHVYPTGIRLCKYACSLPGLAISEIQRQRGLKPRHGLQTQPAAVRQPFGAHDVFEWFVVYLDPGGAVDYQFAYSKSH